LEVDEVFRQVFVLVLICVVSAASLAMVYRITAPLIAEAEEKKESGEALMVILPQADSFERRQAGEMEYFEGYKDGRRIGYILKATASGYAGDINMLVGLDLDYEITGISVLEHQETPGLGANLTEIKSGEDSPWFLRQLERRHALGLRLENVQAITGATITSKAVVEGIREAVEAFREKAI